MEILKPARIAAALLVAWAILAAGCGGSALSWDSPESYVVKTGDTLYSISWRNRLDWRDVARWNGLSNSGLIYPGQTLRLSPPPRSSGSTTSAAPKTTSARPSSTTPSSSSSTSTRSRTSSPPATPIAGWRWPAAGPVVAGFGDKNSMGQGVDIGGRLGDPVRAAASGRVVYAGSGLIGYGKLIIIKHNDTFLSAYGHNRTMAVKEGDPVKVGQKIAEIGEGPGDKPLLHFEIRVNGKPVNPVRYLPKR
ncbi:MAG: peptidoglycan DD-metalloendopeptidase family protein [Chromatiales bacterium]|nr:peptidoglycan DD-metalloendopeptidase family protein [Chromatiales bacterium]